MDRVVLVILILLVVMWIVRAVVAWRERARRWQQQMVDAQAAATANAQARLADRSATRGAPRSGSMPPPPLPSANLPATPSARPVGPAPRTLNLDAGAFAPMSHEQARRAAGGLSAWGGMFWQFARRDLIPPEDDPRTSLIDRAMVGQGMITPERLAEVHTIGRRMDEVRPDIATAHAAADRAAAEDKEARQRIKQQKKAEAAERKRRHAEAVARRKATDITFLGRGVSKGLADRSSDEAKLAAAGLPVLATPADVAAALNLSIPRLRWLAFHADASPVSHYARFTVPKRSGGERLLSAPMPQLAAAQEWVLVNVLEKVPTHAAAHGFVAGRSTVSNAQPHVGKDVVVNTDLKDFFPSITFPRVLGLFRQLGYSPAVATVFALLCTDAPRKKVTYAGRPFFVAAGPRALPQGACTSPAISNLVSRRLDSRLSGIAGKLGWTYTRYADDLSFSADVTEAAGDQEERATQASPLRERPGIGYLLARVRHIAEDEGFAVNHGKTRVLRQSSRQLVTGVVVNDRPGVDRATVRRLRAILHRARTEGLAAQNRENLPHFDAWLGGMIAYVHMVNPRQAAPLRAAYAQLAGRRGNAGGDSHR